MNNNFDPITIKRFFTKVMVINNCWIWTGSKYFKGYGHIRVHGKLLHAHRYSYELLIGEIPKNFVIDHLCRNHACVNPEHLEAVTNRVNILRGEGISAREARKTHCKKGHQYTSDNLIQPKRGRVCRQCNKEHCKNYYMKKRLRINP